MLRTKCGCVETSAWIYFIMLGSSSLHASSSLINASCAIACWRRGRSFLRPNRFAPQIADSCFSEQHLCSLIIAVLSRRLPQAILPPSNPDHRRAIASASSGHPSVSSQPPASSCAAGLTSRHRSKRCSRLALTVDRRCGLTFGRSLLGVGVVAEVGAHPLLGLLERLALAARVLDNLVFGHLAHLEVGGALVGEDERGDGGGGQHGE